MLTLDSAAEIGCSILHKTANKYLDGFWPVECWLWGKIIRKPGLGCWFARHAHGLITVFCHNFKCMQFFWKPDLKSIRSRPEPRCISQLKVAQFCHFGHFCRRFTKAVARNQNFKMARAPELARRGLLLPDTFSQKCNGFLDSPLQQNLAMLCCLKTGSWIKLSSDWFPGSNCCTISGNINTKIQIATDQISFAQTVSWVNRVYIECFYQSTSIIAMTFSHSIFHWKFLSVLISSLIFYTLYYIRKEIDVMIAQAWLEWI